MGHVLTQQLKRVHPREERKRRHRKFKQTRKWMDFICDSKYKIELFGFLTDKIAMFTFPSSKLVYVTSGRPVLHSSSANLMEDCNHEEAIVMHVQYTLQQGMKTITVDTNVVVALVSAFITYTQFSH